MIKRLATIVLLVVSLIAFGNKVYQYGEQSQDKLGPFYNFKGCFDEIYQIQDSDLIAWLEPRIPDSIYGLVFISFGYIIISFGYWAVFDCAIWEKRRIIQDPDQ